jgi:hypothetical protein
MVGVQPLDEGAHHAPWLEGKQIMRKPFVTLGPWAVVGLGSTAYADHSRRFDYDFDDDSVPIGAGAPRVRPA